MNGNCFAADTLSDYLDTKPVCGGVAEKVDDLAGFGALRPTIRCDHAFADCLVCADGGLSAAKASSTISKVCCRSLSVCAVETKWL